VRSRSPEHNTYEAERRHAVAERERNYRKTSAADVLLSERRSPSVRDRDRDRERDRDHDRDRDRERDRDRRDYRDREHRDRDRERDRERDRDGHRDRDSHRDRERDRDHRDHRDNRDYDRRPPRGADETNHYDRERRTREEDRERLYRRRVHLDRDVDELPYGDERPSSSYSRTRPRPSVEEDDLDRRDSGRHSAKRVKLEGGAAATAAPAERAPSLGKRTPLQTTKEKEKEKEPTPSVRAGSEEGEIEEE
jgi:pre-mRNA-processing factor 40